MRSPTHPDRSWKEIHDGQRAFAGGSGGKTPKDRLGRYVVIDEPIRNCDPEHDIIYVHGDDHHCTYGVEYTIPQLLELLGPDATFRDIMWDDRTRCPRCQRLPWAIKQIWRTIPGQPIQPD